MELFSEIHITIIITIVGIVIPVIIGLYLNYKTKNGEFKQKISDKKFVLYDEFLNRLSLLYEDPKNTTTMSQVLNSYHKFALYAPSETFDLLREFLKGIENKFDNDEEFKILNSLVNSMRQDVNSSNKKIHFKTFKPGGFVWVAPCRCGSNKKIHFKTFKPGFSNNLI